MKIMLRESGNDLDRDSELLELITAVHIDLKCCTTSYLKVELKNKMYCYN
jgi:hypothetical protein